MSDKLGPKSKKYIFIGYLREIKGYYFYYRSDKKAFVVQYDVFLVEEFSPRNVVGAR